MRSGTYWFCSGNSPDIRINATSSTPAHPPPRNAANSHQTETMRYPRFLWSRHLPGQRALAALRSCVWDQLNFFVVAQSPPPINKRSGQSRTLLGALSVPSPDGAARLANLPIGRPTAPVPYNQHSRFWRRCKVNFGYGSAPSCSRSDKSARTGAMPHCKS